MLNSSAIDKILNTFLADNEFECSAFLDTDFEYYYSTSEIGYALVVSERMDNLFMDFAKRNGLKVDCGDFLLAFFHELGHNETIDEIDEDDYEEAQEIKATLTDSNEDCEIYFNLADEIEATLWAIDYINNNVEIIEQLAKELQVEINKFLAENNIK